MNKLYEPKYRPGPGSSSNRIGESRIPVIEKHDYGQQEA